MIDNKRVLIIDDDREIWQAFQNVLCPSSNGRLISGRRLTTLLRKDDEEEPPLFPDFELSFAAQGRDGFEMVNNGQEKPFAVAFIDIRMPPGWDGMETAVRIRKIDPNIEIVIVTAYSDRSRDEIVQAVGSPEKLLFLRKPFDPEELIQMTLSLTTKWNLARREAISQSALRESEARFKTLVETTSDVVWETDAAGRFVYCSPVSEYVYGYRPMELIGKVYHEMLLSGDDARQTEKLFGENAKNLKGFHGIEHDCLLRDGHTVPIESSATVVVNDSGIVIGFRGIDRDISARRIVAKEKKLLEAQIRQSQKMEALGMLAGGVAHDINNILTPIMGNVQLAMLNLRSGNPLEENLIEIQRSSERAAALIRQILAFSRKQVLEYKVLDLNTIVENFFKMLKRLIRSDINLVKDLQPGLWPIIGDIGQTEQVLLNLAVNARDASNANSTITIRTRNETIKEYDLFDVDRKVLNGEFVVLAIKDTGHGMEKETLERIFDPFFTTKKEGQGTGLGLSTVYGVIKQHKGRIREESSPNRGTTFYIYFLRAQQDACGDQLEFPTAIRRGKETILVAEDNDPVRMITVSILETFGYKVLEAENGGKALKLLAEHHSEIDLVLSDIVMPEAGGKVIMEAIRANYPHLPLILMSAYPQDLFVEDAVKQGICFLQKPFTPQTLTKKIRETIDRRKDDRP